MLGDMQNNTIAPVVDVPGLVRRVRRAADLSQRELADALGVDQSTVARWESGRSVPDVVTFARALSLADMTLHIVDDDGEQAAPLSHERPRDRQSRRYPAHLDLIEEPDVLTGLPRLSTPHRARRDARRRRHGAPRDHPTLAHLAEERRQQWEERRARIVALMARTRRHPPPEEPPCSCPIGCEERAGCLPECGCACERPA